IGGRGEGAGGERREAVEDELLAGFAVRGRARDVVAELVEDRVAEAAQVVLLRAAVDVEDEDLVRALLQPAAGQVERLLRADVPVAAERVAVDPDGALGELARVEERVAE